MMNWSCFSKIVQETILVVAVEKVVGGINALAVRVTWADEEKLE